MHISLNIKQARAAVIVASLLLAGPGLVAAAGPALPAPVDLRSEARVAQARGVPIVILFSLPDCPYCEVVRRNYLVPLAKQGERRTRPLVRELELTATAPLRGFSNEATSGKILAERYQVKVAPTVVVLDSAGQLLAAPLAGGDVAGMYGAYLDGALEQARATMDATRTQTKIGKLP